MDIKPLSTYFVRVQGTIMLIIILKPWTREQLRQLYNFAADYIYAKCNDSPNIWNLCNRMAIYLITCSIRVNSLVVLSYALAICAPLYKTLFTDENEMILPIILPFINPDTQTGFNINYTYQLIFCIFGSIAVPGCELVSCVLKNNVSVIAAVIEYTLTEFEIRLEMDDPAPADVSLEFRNIIIKIQDFDRSK